MESLQHFSHDHLLSLILLQKNKNNVNLDDDDDDDDEEKDKDDDDFVVDDPHVGQCNMYCETSKKEPFMSIFMSPGVGKTFKNFKDEDQPNLLKCPFPDESCNLLKHHFINHEECFVERINLADRICKACNYTLDNHMGFHCRSCDFYLHTDCALLLSRMIKHKFNKHPLTLRYEPVENHIGEYFCEICEEEFNPAWWFYHCTTRAESMHTACVPIKHECEQAIYRKYMKGVYDFINVKFGGTYEIESHPHRVSLIQGTTYHVESDDPIENSDDAIDADAMQSKFKRIWKLRLIFYQKLYTISFLLAVVRAGGSDGALAIRCVNRMFVLENVAFCVAPSSILFCVEVKTLTAIPLSKVKRLLPVLPKVENDLRPFAMELLQHFSHDHLLSLIHLQKNKINVNSDDEEDEEQEEEKDDDDCVVEDQHIGQCNMCKEEIYSFHLCCYKCNDCDYTLHKFCAELPTTEKNHPLHPGHDLTLSQRYQFHESDIDMITGPEWTCPICVGKTFKNFKDEEHPNLLKCPFPDESCNLVKHHFSNHEESFIERKHLTYYNVLKIGGKIGAKFPAMYVVQDNSELLVKKEDVKTAVERLMNNDEEEERRKRVKEFKIMAKRSMEEG
nr:zinc finger, PHD-type [Tanacetum cinerariifolium]